MLFACLAAMPLQPHAGELYRWLDSSGKVHYGDAPPPDVRAETRKFSDAAAPGEDLPYETRRAQENFPVTLYVGEGCGEYCQQARELLNKRGIPFSEKKLATQEEVDAFKAASGGDTIPTLAVGRTFLQGFLAGQWHSELDIAGYPKTAPYRAPANVGTPDAAPVSANPSAP
jgi:glutaredoxin